MAKDAELIFGAANESFGEIKKDLDRIVKEIERSGATKLRFSLDPASTNTAIQSIQKQSQTIASGMSSSVGKYSKQLTQYYKDLDKQKTSFNAKNLNGIDLEIRKRELAAKQFSSALQSQMQQEQTAQSLKDTFNQKNLNGIDLEIRKRELAGKQFSAQLQSQMREEQAVATASEKATKQQHQAEHSRENDLLQYRKILAQVESQYNRYSDNIQKNTSLNANYQEVISKLRSGIETGNFDFKDVTDARTQIAQLDNTLTETGGKVETFTQKLKNLFGIHLTTALTMVGVHVLIQSLQQMMSSIVEIDTAMTELKKVTDETSNTYSEFLDNAAEKAERLGSTISDIVTATADFARLGYGLPDASTLAEAATVYKNVGDGISDISSASESIISTMKAFGISASNSMSIVDKFNETGNKYAISSQGIGEALKRSASALAVANNTIEESIALAVGMNDTLQDPEKVGTILKTATMYLRAAKTEAEEAGESTEGMANSVSELRAELLKLTDQKVDIMIDED